MRRKPSKSLVLVTLLVVGAPGCGHVGDESSSSNYTAEIAQQTGDVMASIDETGGSTGSLALLDGEERGARRALARLEPPSLGEPSKLARDWLDALVPSAQAVTCATASTWGSCSSNVVTRTFGSCTIGTAVFSGTVTLTWSDAAVDGTCQMTANGHTVTRVPAFSASGRSGGTLTVSKTGTNGQVVTRTGVGTYLFSNDGIRRVFTSARGLTLADYTTTTTTSLSISGASRAGRVVSGGSLRVTNNLTGVYCDYAPSSLTWVATCNCPTSGTWTGTCSDSKTSTLTITGCGSAQLAHTGIGTVTVSLDRCYSI